jgi:Ca2+-binding RTX toxin-like protein
MTDITGTNNSEFLFGTANDDTILGLNGNDSIFGGNGNDLLKGGGGADYLNGGNGVDQANYTDSPEGVTVSLATGEGFGGTAQGDTLVNIENLTGSSHGDSLTGDDGVNILDGNQGNDHLYGHGGADVLIGDNGNDLLKGGGGADLLSGGDGVDTASYVDSAAGVVVSLLSGTGSGGAAQGDTLFSIENLIGSSHNDFLFGSNGNNELAGLGGNDQLWGYAGNDVLRGGDGVDVIYGMTGNDQLHGDKGNDLLVGGDGVDAFIFDTALDAGSNVDTIDDFEHNVDQIWLSSAIFTAVGNHVGNGEFVKGGHAQDSNDYLIYNQSQGKLFYDEDGTGGANKVLFAHLDPGTHLDAGDFLVI